MGKDKPAACTIIMHAFGCSIDKAIEVINNFINALQALSVNANKIKGSLGLSHTLKENREQRRRNKFNKKKMGRVMKRNEMSML